MPTKGKTEDETEMSEVTGRPFKRRWEPAGGVASRPEGQYSGQEPERAVRKSLAFELSEVSYAEREQARKLQKAAGITEALCTGFQRQTEEMDKALAYLWACGPSARALYVKIGKGLATMTEADLFNLCEYQQTHVELLCPRLVEGWTWRAAEDEMIRDCEREVVKLRKKNRK